MRLTWLVLLVVTVCGSTAWGQTRAALTIDQAVDRALEHNLAVLAERVNLSIADARLVTARLRPNPVFSLGADHLDWLGTGYDQVNNAGPPEYSARTDFLFERGGKRARRIDLATAVRTTSQLLFEDRVRQLTLDVQTACADVLRARSTLALAQDSLAALNDLVRLNEQRVRAGDLAAVELLRTQLAQLQFETTVRQAEVGLRVARTRLQALIGLAATDPLPEIEDDPSRVRPAVDLADVTARALAQRPDLLAARAEQARSQAEVRLQLAQGLVDYSVGAEYRRQQGVAGKGNSIGVFFSSNLPLFNRNQGEIARARAEQQQLELQGAVLERNVRQDVDTSFAQYEASRAILDRLEASMLDRAREVRRITEYSYRRGEASLIEYLDAQRAYNDTMQTYNDARADFARSVFQLRAAAGDRRP
ncbi:TolC family protein [Luteitalea sp.]|uniref:TolC family protein n=1 Tax=Luteitalea sp. TaxID=2004800 RepID=UPI0025BFB379|nr:TolC family protein [Luteitalea sp.]